MLEKDMCVLILGSINANVEDRKLRRDQISTLQYIDRQGVHQTDLFESWGELGLSSMAFFPDNHAECFVSTGHSLFYLNIDTNEVQKINIPHLRGIHEMTIIASNLWIANTYYDEIICFDFKKGSVVSRQMLFSNAVKKVDTPYRKEDINFHCNQAFQTFEGEIGVLVHHLKGRQIIKKVADNLIKSHGNGGVVYLNSNQVKKLNLKAPHSVRLIENKYYLFNSGASQLLVFDKGWQIMKAIETNGWGRGSCFSEYTQTLFAGVSAKRHRYLKFFDLTEKTNRVLAVNTKDDVITTEWELSNLEQVNNLYLIEKEVLTGMMRMREKINRLRVV